MCTALSRSEITLTTRSPEARVRKLLQSDLTREAACLGHKSSCSTPIDPYMRNTPHPPASPSAPISPRPPVCPPAADLAALSSSANSRARPRTSLVSLGRIIPSSWHLQHMKAHSISDSDSPIFWPWNTGPSSHFLSSLSGSQMPFLALPLTCPGRLRSA